MNCIKDKDGDDFPFIDQLVLGSNNSVKPRYHKNDDYYYSMDFNTTDNTLEKPIVSIYKPWPSDLKTTLDDS